MMSGVGIALIWALCSVWVYGRILAEEQSIYPENNDVLFSALFGLMGPLLVLPVLFTTSHGVQFLPKSPEISSMSTHHIPSMFQCPGCGISGFASEMERENDGYLCVHCGDRFRMSTGEPIPHDLGDDEPDWSEPSASDLAWAQATMPGKASGHTVGWRVWWLGSDIPSTVIDELDTNDLVRLSDAELCSKLSQIQKEVIEARSKAPHVLLSGNQARWEPKQPIVGYFHKDMPRAHGAGIYALKECPNSCSGEVIGKVALWGPVVEHENGYRARYAYPVELWCQSQKVAEALERHYGVTCHAGMPEGVEARDPFGPAGLAQLQAQQNMNMGAMAAQMSARQLGPGGLVSQGLFGRNFP